MPEIIINNKVLQYSHVINRRLKNVYIKIEKGGNIVLKSSGISEIRAQELLTKKGNWILKKLKEGLDHQPIEIINGSSISCYDKTYSAEVQEAPNFKGIKLIKETDLLKFQLSPTINKQLAIQLLLNKFYRSESFKIVPNRLDYWSQKTGLKYNELKFRKMKRQWGNCSFKNVITINAKASILNPDQLDYLLVHELCHTKVKNHSKQFWKEVEKHLPNYKELDKSLKGYRLD
mgnify:CR=1 FL=1